MSLILPPACGIPDSVSVCGRAGAYRFGRTPAAAAATRAGPRIFRYAAAAMALAVLGLCGSGCATSGYGLARSRDAADIFTLTFGAGGGAKARIGPLQLAAFDNTDIVGLRAGQWLGNGTDLVDNGETYLPLPVFQKVNWIDPVAVRVFEEGNGRMSDYRPDDVLIHSPNPFWQWRGLFGREIFSHGPDSVSSTRGKDVVAQSPMPVLSLGSENHFFGQVEVGLGLIFTVRAGFNAGELADFILGWAGVDMYNDDLELW